MTSPSHDKKAIKVLRATFGAYYGQAGMLVVLGLLGGAFEGIGIGAVVPLLSFLVGDGMASSSNIVSTTIQNLFSTFSLPFTFASVTAFILVLFFMRAGVLAFTTYLRASIAARFMEKEMSALFGDALRAKWEFLLKQKAGYVQATVVRDVQRTAILFETFAQIIQSFTGFLMYLAVAVAISSNITAVTLFVGAGLFFLLRPMLRKTRVVSEKMVTTEKNLSEHLTEYLFGIKTVKTSGSEHAVFGQARGMLGELRRYYTKNALVHSLGTIFIQPIGFLLIIVLFWFAKGSPEFNIAVFGATIYLIQKIFMYLESGQNALHSVGELVPHAANIQRFKNELSSKLESGENGRTPFSFRNMLKAEHVSFSYHEKAPALHDVSFQIEKGEIVGLLGPSGSGKTTIADLVLRLFSPVKGRITLDGTPIEEISLKEWRKRIGYVSQDLFLIDGTIEENIRFFNTALTDDDIKKAAKEANILETIEKLPQGFNTRVGDRGLFLSGGQRQRVVLARVLASRPEILVLDEATSALDNESERLVQSTIQGLHGRITVIIIAHRLSTLTIADRLLVLDGGKIVEEGKPQALLDDKDSYFSRLYRNQQILQ